MRRVSALLCMAGLATAPASAAARPSSDPWSTAQSQTVEQFEGSTGKGRLGAMVMGLTPELRKHFGAPEDRGVLVAQVDPGTPAATAGIEVGDVIVEVRGRKIETAPDVISALAGLGGGEHAKIEVLRDGKPRSIDAALPDSASAAAQLSPRWLRDWTQLLDLRDGSASPFDAPTWSGSGRKPVAETPHETGSAAAPDWLRKLPKLFVPDSDTLAFQGS